MSVTGSRANALWALVRPFTLLAPALGMVSGAVTAIGARHGGRPFSFEPWMLRNMAVGALMAAALNAASNVLNQVCDLEVDRVNKPDRPLVTGRISLRAARRIAWPLYALALLLAYAASPPGTRGMCFWLALAAAAATVAYSAMPLRVKRFGIWANLIIAVPRGLLLRVAGWSTVRRADLAEPWYIGLVFFLFLLGASSTKDYADIEGDRRGGCRTLPVRYGVRASSLMIAPSFVIPFLLMPLGVRLGLLTGHALTLSVLGMVLAAWGGFVVHLILRDPMALATEANHPSWKHMYLMMLVAQVGFAAAYLV